MHEKGPFSAKKSDSKIELSERLDWPPTVAGGKILSLSLYDNSICSISHSLFMQKKVLFLHLLKKLLCVTREQLIFSDSGDDFEHSCITRAQSSSSLEKVNFSPLLHNVLFCNTCTIFVVFRPK